MMQFSKNIQKNKMFTLFSTSTTSTIIRPLSHYVSETALIPKRDEMLEKLKKKKEVDVLIIGGGSTGAVSALDAAQRGLSTLCVERLDFSSGTSSRSTKLLWGGSRYLVQSLVNLFSFDLRLLRSPKQTISSFLKEFRMVLNCHRERTFMLYNQPHLTKWMPITVPLTSWILSPPPFQYPLASLGPLGLFPIFFKFYDALSGFKVPPSYLLFKNKLSQVFPQLIVDQIKYANVFYEGIHDDSRTNLAVAQTAAKEGAMMLNYMEVIGYLHENEKNKSGKVIGVKLLNKENGEEIEVLSKSIVLCGGPFTDSLRKLDKQHCKSAVKGASGVHIVLPWFSSSKPSVFSSTTRESPQLGLVDMNTSDGRFLFLLPWQGHLLVGTTDKKCYDEENDCESSPSFKNKITDKPIVDEEEIDWLLKESSKYLNKENHYQKKDVLSAWKGIRPLAIDPHEVVDPNAATSSASRDHIISYDPDTSLIFIAGGKWTTFREMGEDVIDSVLTRHPELNNKLKNPKSTTLSTHFVGYLNYSTDLLFKLDQKYNGKLKKEILNRLIETYGGRAQDVIEFTINELKNNNKDIEAINDQLLHKDFYYLDSEVQYATRYDWARHPEDILARRTRMAFVNRQAALDSVDKVISIMAKELGWDDKKQKIEKENFLESFKQFSDGKSNLI